MHRSTHALAGAIAALALLAPGASQAVIGTLDDVPAATLLLPYFEVDLDDANGPQTRFTVSNVSEAAQLTHVQLWTDWGTPSFGFDVYLGGRDSVEVDLRQLFAGIVPQTGPTLAGNGPYSNANVAFAGCTAALTTITGVSLPIPDRLAAGQIAALRENHTGVAVASRSNRCTAQNHGDGIARGYITVDTVNSCTTASPATLGYFTNTATTQNVLIGSFALIDRNQSQYPSSPMVHIEASNTDPLTSTPGEHTFYGMYVGSLATDGREALGSVSRARVLASPEIGAETELLVWRERGNTAQADTGVTCGGLPTVFPLAQNEIVAFDESEEFALLNEPPPFPNPVPPPIFPFPIVTQKAGIENIFPWDGGYLHLNLNAAVVGGNAYGNDALQSFVLVRLSRNGAWGAMLPAMVTYRPSGTESQFPPIIASW